jgi:hypothetical protein
MTDQYYDPGTGDWVLLNGAVVERKALYIAEKIKDYDENLELLCLQPERAEGISDAPFIVAERVMENGVPVLKPVLRAYELDDRILERIYMSDTKRRDVLADIMASEDKYHADNARRYEEKREENKDIMLHLAGMKSQYSVEVDGEIIMFYDDRPAVRGKKRINGSRNFTT